MQGPTFSEAKKLAANTSSVSLLKNKKKVIEKLSEKLKKSPVLDM